MLTLRRVGFDTETTGPNIESDRIVTAALIARGGGLPDKTLTWLINPGIDIPIEASNIHGIKDADAKANGQDPTVALEEIALHLAAAVNYGMPIVAFNLAFDWTILDRDLRRNGLAPMADRIKVQPALIDPHVIDKRFDRYRKGSGMRKLQPTAEVYGITITDWHTADADALAAMLIAEEQFKRYRQLEALTPYGLYKEQQAWRAEQQAGLQEWFRSERAGEKRDPNIVIDGSWPLTPFPVAVTS